MTLALKLSDTDRKARLNFVNWYRYGVHAGEIEPHARVVY